jgi:hypothetical protein
MNNNILNSVISGFIAFVLSVIFLIISVELEIAFCLLLSSGLLGYSIAKMIKKNDNLNLNDGLMVLITILFFVVSTVIQLGEGPKKNQFNRFYFEKNSINFEKEIKNSNNNFRKLIFAFDNSGGGLKERINKSSQKQYENYCNEIESTQLFPWANDEKEKIWQFRANNTYGNFLKARLCFDLIQHANDTNEFIVLKIGDPNSDNWKDDGGFKLLEKKNIKKAIQKIIQTKNDESHTNFHTFNNELRSKKNSINDPKSITLYTYSDFFHDCKGRESKDELEIIKNEKRAITKDIVHNCFIDNHPSKRGGEYVLDSNPDFIGEKFFFLDSIKEDEKIPYRVLPSKNEYWFYSQKDNEDINTSFLLIFHQTKKSICSHNTINTKVKDIKIFSINGEEIAMGTIKDLGYKDTITLQYEGKNPPNEKVLYEIIHNNIHYLVCFDIIKECDRWIKYVLFIAALLIGFVLGLGRWWKKK